MKAALPWILALACIVAWQLERMQTRRLRADRIAVDAAARAVAGLRREHERLRQQLESGASVRAARPAPARVSPVAPSAAAADDALAMGEWKPASQWRDQGRSTPAAAVETALWAVAGGDLAAFRAALFMPAASREAAQALWLRLPPEERGRYADAEDLVAAYSMARIPLGEAQLVWLNQSDADAALAAVYLRNPEGTAGSVDFKPPDAPGRGAENLPPMSTPDDSSETAYLALHRGTNGWQLVVPPAAIERLARVWAAAATAP